MSAAFNLADRICQNCVHFLPAQPGFCRRYPPSFFIQPSKLGGLQHASSFPPVQPEMRCGEFAHKGAFEIPN